MAEQTIWQKIGSGLKDNWNDLWEGAENLFVFLVTSLPYAIPLSAVTVVIILALKKRKKRKQAQKEAE